MTVKTKRFACSAFDATLIVTAAIDFPSEATQVGFRAFECLSEYSACCEHFVRGRLFSELENEYRESYSSVSTRFAPYRYELKIVETYFDEIKSSYLLKASLLRSGKAIDFGAQSAIFINGLAVPPRSLVRKRIPSGGIVLLGADGVPDVFTVRDVFASNNLFK